MNNNYLAIFEGSKIRRVIYQNKWYFSVVDIVSILTESTNPTDYFKKLRKRDVELGLYIGTNCPQIEMVTSTSKKRKTLAGNIEHILRIVQSIPSPKAEPFKMWLAKVGHERIQEINDPEIALNRSRNLWKKHGRPEAWIQQRMMGQETRNKLTDYWSNNNVKDGVEFAILTNIIHQEWTDLSVQEHKALKKLDKSHNLRDHMNEAELILTALAELSTRQIAKSMESKGLSKNKIPAKKGGGIARNARIELEQKTGKKVVTGKNFLESSKTKKILPR